MLKVWMMPSDQARNSTSREPSTPRIEAITSIGIGTQKVLIRSNGWLASIRSIVSLTMRSTSGLNFATRA